MTGGAYEGVQKYARLREVLSEGKPVFYFQGQKRQTKATAYLGAKAFKFNGLVSYIRTLVTAQLNTLHTYIRFLAQKSTTRSTAVV